MHIRRYIKENLNFEIEYLISSSSTVLYLCNRVVYLYVYYLVTKLEYLFYPSIHPSIYLEFGVDYMQDA